MPKIESFQQLKVWQWSIEMTVAIYRLSQTFPSEERFGLTSQLRRAAVSVASNIAEGYGRGSRNEYTHFVGMARGSNSEVQTQLIIARELGLGEPDHRREAEALSQEVARMLTTLLRKLKSPPPPQMEALV